MSAAPQDVQAFAAWLTRLKEGTDRSYGQLARRLHMNTSTLHRYCAGDTVPTDFAPVERFAALCGATAEERMELHRLWLLAVAARQRARTGGAGAGAGTGAGGSKGAGTGAETAADAETKTEAETRAEGETGVEAQAEAEAEAAAEAAAEAEAEAEAEVGVVAGPHAATEVGADSVSREAESTGPTEALGAASPASPSRRPWHRRRPILASAAVAVALLTTLGSYTALSSSERSPAGRTPQDGPVPVRTPSGGDRLMSPSPSPSSSAEPTTEPTSASPTSGSEGSKPSPSRGDDTARRPPAAADVPLTWTADSQVWEIGCSHDYVIAKPPKQVPPPPPPQDAGAWAATQQAVHGRQTLVEISVQGRSSKAVVLKALRVRVVGRSAPAGGNVYAMDQGCGGAISSRYFDVDLDKGRPIARPVGGSDMGTPIPAVRMPYKVSAEDPEVLLVSAETATCDCRWYLELEWSSEGRTGTVRIDDHGRPFRTTGIKGLPHYMYATWKHQWEPLTDGRPAD
ncbi:helix-turn-helix domain-containing protein [Streptomyces neyagawaensis]|uniref:helix-turn-helix domain-containing protein n=1 Tax=Streptomyces neyagawaensis TaxID=42238 RepID=UPI00201CF9AB|nr:helix-turn-helix transcriptional regulator [Streptomyces neyagawaensis]MCL6732398.1 helix-turn-helix domain-containing protein [Streptomyces neyagawaensis]MDE1685880.1 helix-turn-helix transcriptional regulator [Streptomyces neyagawaensis]